MATPYEAFQSRDRLSRDKNGQRTGQRIFFTDYRDPSAAIADATYSVVPAYGAAFPGDSALTLDRKTAENRGDGTFAVTCDYSTNSRFIDNKIDKNPATYYEWGGSDKTVTERVFLSQKVKISTPDSETGTAVWEQVDLQSEESRQVMTLTIRTTIQPGPGAFASIKAQKNKLHTHSGVKWLFRSGEARQTSNGEWSYTYVWEADEGTPKLVLPYADTDIDVPIPNGYPGGYAFMRPPYTRLIYKPYFDPTELPGKTVAVARYTEDADGWRSLPGVSGVIGL